MTEKKDTFIQIRLPESLNGRAQAVAEHFRTNTSALCRSLLETYCDAYDEHGVLLPYPPQYARFEGIVTVSTTEVLKAAEPGVVYGRKKK